MLVLLFAGVSSPQASAPDPVRIGMIGLDTSHSVQFAKLINTTTGEGLFDRYEVVAAHPYGSRTIESAYERIPEYTRDVRELGIDIYESIDELLDRVDVVLLETNDGTLHLEQALQVIDAGKPLFIDKPVAASLVDVLAIYEAAEAAGVPVFSASSLRYGASVQAVRNGSIGDVRGAFAYSPAMLEPSHTDLYWYGIHGVETLVTLMGRGCETVVRVHRDDADLVTCTWEDGRIGTFHGMREGALGYGGTAFGTDEIADVGYDGYRPLVEAILTFFESNTAPVEPAETIEIYAIMTAADESKSQGGAPVRVEEVLEEARTQASRMSR